MLPIKKNELRKNSTYLNTNIKSGFFFFIYELFRNLLRGQRVTLFFLFIRNSNVQSFPIKTGVSTSWLEIDGAKNVVIFCSPCVRHQRGPIWIFFQINNSDYTTDRGPVFFFFLTARSRETHFRNITSISVLNLFFCGNNNDNKN